MSKPNCLPAEHDWAWVRDGEWTEIRVCGKCGLGPYVAGWKDLPGPWFRALPESEDCCKVDSSQGCKLSLCPNF